MGKMPVSLRIAKRRKVEAPAAAFADPDDNVEPDLTVEERDEQVQKLKVVLWCLLSILYVVVAACSSRGEHAIQDEGFEKAESKDFSAAIRLWDMALALRPQYAVLHEMKAQV